jgi:hypothetical protein
MRQFHQQQHRFYRGIDPHARSMNVCIVDSSGGIVPHRNLVRSPGAFLEVSAPYRGGPMKRPGASHGR